MPSFLVAPTEPPLLKAIGQSSIVPEHYGSDVLWHEPEVGLIGCQRKTVEDLIASIHNGRLALEFAKMTPLPMSFLIIEGRPRWTPDGALLSHHSRFSRAQFRGYLRSVQLRGIIVDYSDDVAGTVALVEELAKWAAKRDHRALDRRPNPQPQAEGWGKVGNKQWAMHLLQSIPLIGPGQAEAIWDHFDGKLPIGVTVTKKELLGVKGLGPKRVDAVIGAFEGKALG